MNTSQLAVGIADDPAKRTQYLMVTLAAEVVRTCAERFAARWEGCDLAFDLPPVEVDATHVGVCGWQNEPAGGQFWIELPQAPPR